jgi:hypothetical protein
MSSIRFVSIRLVRIRFVSIRFVEYTFREYTFCEYTFCKCIGSGTSAEFCAICLALVLLLSSSLSAPSVRGLQLSPFPSAMFLLSFFVLELPVLIPA